MRIKGTYIVNYQDGSYSVMYWTGTEWVMFGVSATMNDEEADFVSLNLLIHH